MAAAQERRSEHRIRTGAAPAPGREPTAHPIEPGPGANGVPDTCSGPVHGRGGSQSGGFNAADSIANAIARIVRQSRTHVHVPRASREQTAGRAY